MYIGDLVKFNKESAFKTVYGTTFFLVVGKIGNERYVQNIETSEILKINTCELIETCEWVRNVKQVGYNVKDGNIVKVKIADNMYQVL